MEKINFKKTSILPIKPEKNTLYFVENGDYAEVYLTSNTGVYKKVGNTVMIGEIAVLSIPPGSITSTQLSTIVNNDIANGVTAFGWGDHSLVGYLTSFSEVNDLTSAVVWANVPNVNITESSVTQHEAALTITESQIIDLTHFSPTSIAVDYGFAETDLLYEPLFSKNTAFNKDFGTLLGTVAEGNDSRILNGQTAFGWGDHAGLYLPISTVLPQNTPVVAGQLFNSYNSSTGVFGTTAETDPIFTASDAASITASNIANWNTAFSWGDHIGLYAPLVHTHVIADITDYPTSIPAYITDAPTIALLVDTANWNIDGVYGGTAITGTFQGQKYVNTEYFFEATADNVWIRLIRG